MFQYNSYQPENELKKWIKSYWLFEKQGKEKLEDKIIMPDGCVYITFILSNHTKSYFCCESTIEYGTYISPSSLSRYKSMFGDNIYAVDVALYPGVFYNLFGIPITTFENKMYNVKELSLEFDEFILDRLLECKGNARLSVNALNEFFYKLFYNKFEISNLLLSTSSLMKKGDLEKFYATQNLSTRQIERKIKESTGLNPKTIHRISRFYNTLEYIKHSGNNLSFTQMTNKEHFTDQSHFIKEFNFFTGKTPKNFLLDSQNYLQYNFHIHC